MAELFFSSSGRLSRTAFAAGIAPVMGGLWLYGRWAQGAVRTASAWVVLPVLVFSGCCLVSRRLHDLGRAGWWAAYPLGLLIACWPRPGGGLGWVCAALLALLAAWLMGMRGQRAANRFGASLAG